MRLLLVTVGLLASLATARAQADISICLLPKVVGPCEAAMPSFYYDVETSSCEEFSFGGCDGNANRFATALECEEMCVNRNRCTVPACESSCEFGYKKDANNCPTCDCVDLCKTIECTAGQECRIVTDDRDVSTATCVDSAPVDPDNVERPPEPPSPDPCALKPLCMMFCKHGNKKDEEGCPICECNPDPCAQQPMCMIFCEHGNVKDENGCPTCECKPDPCADRVMCMIFCEHGNKKDSDGCSICECNDAPTVPPCTLCGRHCQHGMSEAKDENGCDTCECNPDPCANTPMCMIFCEHGNVKDENGCPTCECKPDPCADRVMCMIFCEHGNKKDKDGCSICECNDAPTVPPCTLCIRDCEHGMSEAKDENGCDTCECKPDPCANTPMCMIFCEHGNVKDENGCPTCECKPDPCADRVMCMIFCEHGNKKDKDGCSICECNDAPTVPPCTLCIRDCQHGMSEAKDENGCDTCECNPDPCANTPMCMIFCEHGNVKDENGCPTCECKPDPCADRVMCMIFCEHGNKKDKDGCSICECNDAPTVPPCTLCIRDCEHGMSEAKDENGCDTCECKPDPCANTPMCMIYCEHGMKKDENGCFRCECKPDPCEMCTEDQLCAPVEVMCVREPCDPVFQCQDAPPIPVCHLCGRDCQHGMSEAKDENGCLTCECNPDPCANKPMCAIYCEHGMKKDENGCPRCECNPDPCEMCTEDQTCVPVDVMCVREPCEPEFECRDKRVPVPDCSPVRCRMFCKHGWKKDERGCDKCECAEPCENNTCTTSQRCESTSATEYRCIDPCRPVLCRMMCPYGWKKDENGCSVCGCYDPCEKNTCSETQRCEVMSANETKCVERCPSMVMCQMFCDYGFKKDSNGCDTCLCVDPCEVNTCTEGQRCQSLSAEDYTCVPVDEPCPMPMCITQCDFGYAYNERGCMTCDCRPDPCLQCSSNQMCTVEEVMCVREPCDPTVTCRDLPAKPAYCALPSETGRCRGFFRKWYFDNATQTCKQFIYGGCGGNDNNFGTRDECEARCVNNCEIPTCGEMFCEYGWDVDEEGCPTCSCYQPCKPDTCDKDSECVAFQGNCSEGMCILNGRQECRPKKCPVGSPLLDLSAQKEIFCGRGPQRQDCPAGYYCNIHPTDMFAVCCRDESLPLVRPDICSLPREAGQCQGSEQKWHYSEDTGTCLNFTYTGCDGNANNFESQRACNDACMVAPPLPCGGMCSEGEVCDSETEFCVPQRPRCAPAMCLMFCQFGFTRDANDCPLCKCYEPCENVTCGAEKECKSIPPSTPGMSSMGHAECVDKTTTTTTVLPSRPPFCELPPSIGRCRSAMPRWFRNVETGQCEQFTYGGCGGNDNRFETEEECQTICMVEVRTVCQEFMCLIWCEHGNVKDENGCDTCKCIDPCEDMPCMENQRCEGVSATERRCIDECEPVRCRMMCRHGWKKDERGCDYCSCVDPCEGNTCKENQRCEVVSANSTRCVEECEPVRCRMMCPFGWKKNERGCDYCSCVDPCEVNTCSSTQKCEPQSATEYRCADEEECEPVRCRMMCPFGWKKNERGCDYCSCVDPCEVNTCSSTQKCEPQSATEYGCADEEECEPVRCRMMCPFGWKKNERGCDYCSCVDPCEDNSCSSTQKCEPQSATEYRCADAEECEPVRCRMMCPFGWKKNERGCDYCSCVDPCEVNTCSSTQKCEPQSATEYRCADEEECEPVRCRMMCPFGWKKNERGCDYCSCVDPCEVNTCSSTQKCEPQSATEYGCADEEECEPVRCRMMCPFGWKKNERGCDYCSCVDPCEDNSCSSTQKCEPQSATEYRCADAEECEPVRCRMMCPFGWKKNERGCDYCSCVDPCEVNTCSSNQKCEPQSATEYRCADEEECEPVRCRMMCPFGWKKNERGCDYCSCADPCEGNSCSSTQKCEPQSATEYRCADEEECEPVRCRMMCPLGWKKNERGCDYCSCADPCEGNSCSSTQKCEPQSATEYRCADICPPYMCLMHCEFGFANDENGCDICKCVNPCEDNSCAGDERCEALSATEHKCVVDDACARVDCEPGYVCRIADCDKLQEPSCQPKLLCIQEDKNLCLERQNNALFSLWLKPKSDIFVPRCQENGLFRQVQCNDFIGMCWCVDQVTGEAKANTRVRGNPNCERPFKDEDVCPGDQAMRSRCSPLLCANHPCVTRRDLGFKPVCRVNPCRDTCEVEFYNPANNSPVECQKEKTECISKLYDTNKYFLNKNQGQYVDMLNWWFSDVRDVTEEPDMKPMPEPDMEPTPEPDMEDMMKTTERPMGPTRMTPRGRTNRPIMPTRGPMGPTGTPGRSGASRGTMGPMDPPGPMGPSGPLGPQRPRTTRRPLPSQAPLQNIGMLSGVSMPMCTHSGSYAPKQCQGELCWCVQADGTPIDKTMTTGQLTCGARGIDPYMSFGNRMQCPNGVTPQPCPDACLNAQCNSGKKTVTCKADPCDGCAVKFFDDMGEEFPCMEEGTCEWVMETDWYLNDMVCQINYKGSSCHQMNFFESEEECMLEKSFKMPTAKQCQYACMDASCPEHPDAVCFARGSDCEVTFVDIANGKPVNCEKVKRVCEQHNSRTIKQAMRAGADMRQLSMKQCDKFGNYKATQCDDERTCWCVEKNGQVLPESLYKLQPNQQLECEQPFPDEIEGMVKFDANYDNIISMDSFRSFMKTSIAKALNVDAVRVIITNIKRGSIIVDYTVKINPQNEEETSDVIARVDNFNTQVNEGDILLQTEAEDGNPMELRATEGNVEFVYIGAVPPPTTTQKPEETSLSPGYIALIIIIVALVCVIIFGFVMYCRNREKSEKERRWMDYKKQISNQGLISSSRASTYSAASSLPEKSAVDYDAESQGYDNGGYKGVSSITDPSMVVTTMPDPPKPVQSTA